MKPEKALERLISRAHKRLGTKTDAELSDALAKMHSPPKHNSGMVATWRWRTKLTRSKSGGVSFESLLPLLEAAGVFSNELAEVGDLLDEVDRLEAENAELVEQRRRQQLGREEA